LTDILPKAKFLGANEVLVHSCCGHWSDCEANDLFVAIVGAETDGHEWAHEAIKRGASAIVTERLLTVDRPQVLVSDSRAAYGKICQALAGTPSQRLLTIGVSGTDGKTVTSHLIRSILQAAKLQTGLVSSIEVNLGNDHPLVPNQRLTSPLLADQLSHMAMNKSQCAVLEVSSIELAQRVLDGINFDIAVLTNLRRDHLDYHGSTENYRRAQVRLLKYLKSSGMAVLNADDPASYFLLEQLETPVLTIGIKQEAQVKAKILERSRAGQTFMIQAGCESIPVRTSIIGDQYVYDCLAATAVGLCNGIDLATIASAIAGLARLPGRMERIECGQDYGLWIDSSRSASQVSHAIRSVKQVCRGKVWCLLSTHKDQTPDERKRLGEIADRTGVETIVTQSSIQTEPHFEPAHQVIDGFDEAHRPRVIPNRFRAIEWALSQAKADDCVLITGLGEKPFALVGEECWTISDRDVCQAWLYDQSSMLENQMSAPEFPEILKFEDFL
jgi:UDP-N-acetylmuramoyl-L-alanyl-D-glutamate--2,6-diaminopimelate ligase